MPGVRLRSSDRPGWWPRVVAGPAVLLLAVLLIATGCTGRGAAAPAHAGDEPTPAAPTATALPTGGISVAKVVELRLPGSGIGPPAMDGRRVVVPFGGLSRHRWDRVGSIGLGDGSRQTVARSHWPAGLINWVAVAGDWVAWVDQDHRQGDSDPRVLWRVRSLNTVTHERRLLASNGSTPDPYVPQVHGHDGSLFWTQAETDRSARERVWRTGSKQPRDRLRHTEMTPGSETVAHGRLVYLGPSGIASHGHTVGGDCWSVPLDGSGAARPLTRTGLAMGCSVAGDSLVWTQHVDPDGPLPADGILDDPYEFLAAPVAGGPERLLHRGYLPTGYPVAGAGFVVWHGSGGHPVVHSLSSHGQVRLPGHADGAGLTSDGGHLLAYTSTGPTGSTVTVVRVRLPH